MIEQQPKRLPLGKRLAFGLTALTTVAALGCAPSPDFQPAKPKTTTTQDDRTTPVTDEYGNRITIDRGAIVVTDPHGNELRRRIIIPGPGRVR